MDCGTAQDLMVPWQDGELPPARVDELTEHVDGCARCGRQLELLSRQQLALCGLKPALPELRDDAFWADMDARLSPELDRLGGPPAPQARSGLARREFRVSTVGLVAYAAALLLALGWGWSQLVATQSAEAELHALDAELQRTRRLLAESAPPRLQAPLEAAPRPSKVVQVSHRGQL